MMAAARLIKKNALLLGLFLFLSLILGISACGDQSLSVAGPKVRYYLERSYTGKSANSLVLEVENAKDYRFSLSGVGFSADIPLDEAQAIRNKTELTYTEEGLYSMGITITRPDGVDFVRDRIGWDYSTERPAIPAATLSEKATSDQDVKLFLTANLSSKTTEIFIKGDLETNSDGVWTTIPSSLSIPLRVSAADGLKTISIKYRNIYGNESDSVTLSILKKSIGPKNCTATLTGSIVATRRAPLYVAAENDGDVFYTVTGDLDLPPTKTFTTSVEDEVLLTAATGEKNLVVAIEDIAGNKCPDIPLTVTYDPSYSGAEAKIKDNALWTDSIDVTLVSKYDHLPETTVDMYVSGGVDTTPVTNKWIPFAEELTVRLAPVDGNRFVFVYFKDSRGRESPRLVVNVFLKPSVEIYGSSPPYSVVVSQFVPISSLSLTGCAETYQNVALQESFSCTPTGPQVKVDYFLNDGTTVTRSASF